MTAKCAPRRPPVGVDRTNSRHPLAQKNQSRGEHFRRKRSRKVGKNPVRMNLKRKLLIALDPKSGHSNSRAANSSTPSLRFPLSCSCWRAIATSPTRLDGSDIIARDSGITRALTYPRILHRVAEQESLLNLTRPILRAITLFAYRLLGAGAIKRSPLRGGFDTSRTVRAGRIAARAPERHRWYGSTPSCGLRLCQGR